MKKFSKTPLAAAMGTLVLSSLAAHVNAETNPFTLTELASPYMQAAADKLNNKVSETSCGSNTGTGASNKTGDDHAKHAKKTEGSCGEGKCGAMMSNGKMNKGMESSCGAMMKGKEGSCGMMGMNHGATDASAQAHDHADTNKNSKAAEHSCGAMMKGMEGSCGAKVDADAAAGK